MPTPADLVHIRNIQRPNRSFSSVQMFHTHTCSEQSLRILMWNASYVQKHSNYTWQEWVGEKTREKIKRSPSAQPMQDERSMKLTLPFQHSQILSTLTDCENHTEIEVDIGNSNWRHAGSRLSQVLFREMLKNAAGTQSWSGSVSPRTGSVFVEQCLSVVHCPLLWR